ncbi:unnamed protein product [Parnassius apollo]|uniref:(apollo) hypothetical protein n=1 Tax=Parnassius apollo TaxID=110799 RepID=A0A8S3W1A1_PARAO|nr:unnamed protein product [Parnassius apollo]
MYLLKRVAKVKKKLFEDDEISENDNIEDTPNKNIVNINKKLFERQRETKKIPVSLSENDCLLIPLNMPVDEMLIPSGELPILNEFPDVNENSYKDPAEQQISEKKNKNPSRKRKRQPEIWKRNINKIKEKEEKSTQGQKENSCRLELLNPCVKVIVSLCVLQTSLWP